jgi:hypothetical protein
MTKPTETLLARTFDLYLQAALAGQRCPQNRPHGPIYGVCTKTLVDRGMIRVEVYSGNFRRVVIRSGDHAGKATADPPRGGKPYLVNGIHVARIEDRRGKIAP